MWTELDELLEQPIELGERVEFGVNRCGTLPDGAPQFVVSLLRERPQQAPSCTFIVAEGVEEVIEIMQRSL